MASNGGGAGSSQKPALPKYYMGIPKDLGKKTQPTPRIVPKLDAFGASILANFERNQKAAREKRKAEEEARARARRLQSMRKEQERRIETGEAAKKMLRKSLGASSRSRFGSSSKSRGGRSDNDGSSSTSRSLSARRKGSTPTRKRRRRNDDDDDDDDDGRSVTMKGMERVQKKRRVRGPEIRNTSDYSDMFGDSYLLGAEVAATKELAKTSKEETERVRAAAEEKKAERERLKAKSEQFDAAKKRMEQRGELKTKAGREKLRKLREKLQSHDYESVDAMRAETNSAFKQPKTKKAREEATARDIAARKASLKARLSAMVNEPEFHKFDKRKDGGRSVSKRDPPPKRKHLYSDEEDSGEDLRRVRKKPMQRRPSYISESEPEEDGSDDSDGGGGGFMTSFADVEEEEKRSAAIGRLEDRRELRREAERKRMKAQRRREYGVDD